MKNPHPVFLTDLVQPTDVIPHFRYQKRRHLHNTIALGSLRISNDIPPADALIGFVDPDSALIEIEVLGSQSQELAFTDSAPVQHFEGVVGARLAHHRFNEFLELLLGPDQHFPILRFTHVSDLRCRILLQIIETDSVVEDGAELIVQRLQIHRGEGFTVFVPMIDHLVLPGNDILGRDLIDLPVAEERQDFRADDILFSAPGVFLDTRSFISSE